MSCFRMHEILLKLLTQAIILAEYRNGGSGTMPARTLERLKRHLRPGRVYRREDLLPWSHSVDRHLKELIADGTLQKLRNTTFHENSSLEKLPLTSTKW